MKSYLSLSQTNYTNSFQKLIYKILKTQNISENNTCEELLVVGPEYNFSPFERNKFGFGTYKYIGLRKMMDDELEILEGHPQGIINWTIVEKVGNWSHPVYLFSQNTSSRVSIITRFFGGYGGSWLGWVNC